MLVRPALALALTVALLLAGCTDEPEPKMPDPAPTSSEPSPSPSETETVEAESAEEFIRRWSEALKDMQATGNTEAFRELGPACESCIATADRVSEIYQAGGVIEWDGWTVLNVEPLGRSTVEYRLVEESAPTRYREGADAPWQRLTGGRTSHVIELEPAGESWVVVRSAELAE